MDEESKPEISRVSIKFVQDGNTLGTTDYRESLELFLEFQMNEKEGPFYVIKTDGWSFDNIEDISYLLKRANKIIEKND